jgi:hypothetical protein
MTTKQISDALKSLIAKIFKIRREIEESKDLIFIAEKKL